MSTDMARAGITPAEAARVAVVEQHQGTRTEGIIKHFLSATFLLLHHAAHKSFPCCCISAGCVSGLTAAPAGA